MEEYVVTRYMFKDNGKYNGETAIIITPRSEFTLPPYDIARYWTASAVHKSYEAATKARDLMLATNKIRNYKLIQFVQ